MSIKKEETDILINTIQKSIDTALQKNKKDITEAYEQMQDLGGLPISIVIKLQGDSIQVKSVINFSFPKDRFKEVYKDTIELKQVKLEFEKPPGKGKDKPTQIGKKK